VRAKKLVVGFAVALLSVVLLASAPSAAVSGGWTPPEVDSADTQAPISAELEAHGHQDQFGPASHHPGSGYWMLDISGQVYAFGSAEHLPGRNGDFPNCFWAPQWGFCDFSIDIEVTPRTGIPGGLNGNGFWLLDTTGGVIAVGDAEDAEWFHDFPLRRNDPWMSISSTKNGQGMWGFSFAGCVETLGNAVFYGDMCGVRLNAPVVGSAVTPSGRGYYMVAEDGGIFAFGDARFYGSTGSMRLNQPVTDMVVTPTGKGYWLVALDGGIFAFGDARFYGSMGSVPLNRPISGMVASPTGGGYLMVAEDGGIFAFGDVPFHGSLGRTPPEWPIVAVAVK
jgi:hypothetical protein